MCIYQHKNIKEPGIKLKPKTHQKTHFFQVSEFLVNMDFVVTNSKCGTKLLISVVLNVCVHLCFTRNAPPPVYFCLYGNVYFTAKLSRLL